MAFTLFTSLATPILAYSQGFTELSGNLIKLVVPIVLAGFGVVIAWQGLNIIRGAGGQNHFLDLFAKSLRTFLVLTLCLTSAAYTDNVVGIVKEFRIGVINSLPSTAKIVDADGKAENEYKRIDQTMDKVTVAYDIIIVWSKEHIDLNIFSFELTGIIGFIAAAIIYLMMLIFCATAMVNLLVIDFSLNIVYGLGPLFVACLAFESTQRYFDTWLGAVFKYIFTVIVIFCVISMSVGIIEGFSNKLATDINGDNFISTMWGAVAACGVMILILINAPSIASDLAGGMALNLTGPAKAAQLATGAAKTAVGAAGSVAKGTVGAAAFAAGKVGNTERGQAFKSSGGAQKFARAINGMRNFGKAVGGTAAGGGRASNRMTNAYKRATKKPPEITTTTKPNPPK
ncbi:type IV secretion system protein [Oxalobacteraceae bacterium]|nr:type IV secretion system protein [Oxalobacteraceae bacterium]